MSDNLVITTTELAGLMQWAASKVGDHYDLDEAEERLERSRGIHRQQQQMSRESETAMIQAEAAKSPEQRRAEHLSRLERQILRVGVAFLKQWITEIRLIVCSDKKLREAGAGSGISAPTVAAGLAASLTSALKFDSPVAICVATVVIAVVGTAGLKAFCAMTTEQAIDTARKVQDSLRD